MSAYAGGHRYAIDPREPLGPGGVQASECSECGARTGLNECQYGEGSSTPCQYEMCGAHTNRCRGCAKQYCSIHALECLDGGFCENCAPEVEAEYRKVA